MQRLTVGLRPIANNLNLPTVIKTAIFPGDQEESLVVATQVGEIFYIKNNTIRLLLDISRIIIDLGAGNGYDERGLLGLAFHPDFYYNGLFYIHYSLAGTQGPGALSVRFNPEPCDTDTLHLVWSDRENRYDHIDTVEEWALQEDAPPVKRRTLLNLRRPFMNHNGVNTLTFSPETGRLVLTTGDGGAGYDPFNLSQNDMEIAGKIIEIDVDMDIFMDYLPAVTRFDELPQSVQASLTVMAKGVRNITGISYQRFNNYYIKYVGNVGQDLVESVFSFVSYRPLPVTDIVRAYTFQTVPSQEGLINFGWRGWEGIFPTFVMRPCPAAGNLNQKITLYYDEAVNTAPLRIYPLTCYYHQDPRPDKFQGVALTGVQPYMGSEIPELSGGCVFTDFSGVLAYTFAIPECRMNDYRVIDIDFDFMSNRVFFTSLGTNRNQTKLYLGVYGSANVTDLHRGSIYEIIRI